MLYKPGKYFRPVLPLDSSLFENGVHKACFSDLWRCLDQVPEQDVACISGACNKNLRGLCALPPARDVLPSPGCGSRVYSDISWDRTEPGQVSRKPCPGLQQGEAEWKCTRVGVWDEKGPDLSLCGILVGGEGLLDQNPEKVLDKVQEKRESMSSGDIPILLEFLHSTSVNITSNPNRWSKV